MSLNSNHSPEWGGYFSGAIGAVEVAQVVAAPVEKPAEPLAVDANAPLTPEEIAQVNNLPPSVQPHVAVIIQNAATPADVSRAMREVLDIQQQIAQGEDPHVSPQLSVIKDALQQEVAAKRAMEKGLAEMIAAPAAAISGPAHEAQQPAAPAPSPVAAPLAAAPSAEANVTVVTYAPQPDITLASLGALPTPNVPDARSMQPARDDVGARVT